MSRIINVRGEKSKKPKAKSPFSNLGKDEKSGSARVSDLATQGKRLTGATLLKKAMGQLSTQQVPK